MMAPGSPAGHQQVTSRSPLFDAAGLLVAPALVSAALAVTGGPPLRMEITTVRRSSANAVSTLTVKVTNTGGDPLTPHYMLTTGQGTRRYWTRVRGPATVPAHSTVTVELRAPAGRFVLPGHRTRLRLRAFTASPQTLSTEDVERSELTG